MYNNEKVKEIQRVKNLSLEEMRAKRLELFTDFHNKRNTAITEVNTKRNEVLTLETDGKTEVSRLVTNTESEIIVDTKHKVDNNETGKTGITEALTNGLNNIKKVLNKYTENHTIPVANKLGNYTASELISKYNARLKLPKKSIVFDYTQGISAYDISEGRYIRPEGYESTLINKGEGIFESADGKLGGRIILNKGLFVGGKYENLFNNIGMVLNPRIRRIDDGCIMHLTVIETALNNYVWYNNLIDNTFSYGSTHTISYDVISGLSNFSHAQRWTALTGNPELEVYMPSSYIIMHRDIEYRDGNNVVFSYHFNVNAPIGSALSVRTQITHTKSYRPFIKPNYKVPDTNIKYPLYRDYKVIIMKMEKLYPEYDVINLLGDDKFILQVKKDIQSLFTREENNVFIFDKVNKKMYINGIEVSNKLFNYVELHNDLVCWYSHTSYKENCNDKRGRWFDLSSNGYHMNASYNVSDIKLNDAIRIEDGREYAKAYTLDFNSISKNTGMTFICRVRCLFDRTDFTPIFTLKQDGSRALNLEILRDITGKNQSMFDARNGVGSDWKYRAFGNYNKHMGLQYVIYRLKDNVLKINGDNNEVFVSDSTFDNIMTHINSLSVGVHTYRTGFDISTLSLYKKYLTDEEVQTELNKLGW